MKETELLSRLQEVYGDNYMDESFDELLYDDILPIGFIEKYEDRFSDWAYILSYYVDDLPGDLVARHVGDVNWTSVYLNEKDISDDTIMRYHGMVDWDRILRDGNIKECPILYLNYLPLDVYGIRLDRFGLDWIKKNKEEIEKKYKDGFDGFLELFCSDDDIEELVAAGLMGREEEHTTELADLMDLLK